MRISEMLNAIASWLEDPNNEAMLLAEYHDESLAVVAESCVEAANILKNAALEIESIEPEENNSLTPEGIESVAALASELDKTGDEELIKQANVLDALLLTIAAPKKTLEDATKKYTEPREEIAKKEKLADAVKDIDKSNMTKTYRIMESPLSSRYCPDHPGTPIARVGDNVWQCDLDKKTYNFEQGFTLENGSKVPGGSVANQGDIYEEPPAVMFSTREERIQANKG